MKYRTTKAALKHLLEGQLALSEVESAGVRVDKTYLETTILKIEKRIAKLKEQLESDKQIAPIWRQLHRHKTNFGSRTQLAQVLFDYMGIKSSGETATGRQRTDKTALEIIDIPFVQRFLKVEDLKKTRSTFLEGIRRAMVERDGMWFVHPDYKMNVTVTFRRSCSDPNFQNNPIRNPEIGEMVRRCYIPRPNRHFCEPDLSQIEVRIPACYTKDPALVKYIKDKSTDMHRDMAKELFLLDAAQITKEVRHTAKNGFVFPSFYGSVYFQTAPAIWEMIIRRQLKLVDGTTLLKLWLEDRGITCLGECDPNIIKERGSTTPGTFVDHVKKVEESFWKKFKVYARWKNQRYDEYRRDGCCCSFFGFAWDGLHKRNEIINYPIQADASNTLLWALIRMVKWLRKYKMKSLIVGEIHDAMQQDNDPKELQDVLSMSHQIMTEDVRKAHPWITVPLESETDVSPMDMSWQDKAEWVRNPSGIWELKKRVA